MYSKLMSKQSNHEALDGIASEERRITAKSTHSGVAAIIAAFWVIELDYSLRYEKSLYPPLTLASSGDYFYHLVDQLFFLNLSAATLAPAVALAVGLFANPRSLKQLN